MNFTHNEIPSIKKPTFTGYQSPYERRGSKKSISWLGVTLMVVGFFVVLFLVLKNLSFFSGLFSSSSDDTGLTFTIGSSVDLSGVIQSDGDLVSYTHTLTLPDLTIVGLKSRSLDLTTYTGVVTVQGMVEKQFKDMYIVEVSFVSGALVSSGMSGQLLGSGSGIFLRHVGMYLPAQFGEKYVLLNQGENGSFKVQNIATNQLITVSYFACTASDPNKNCTQLQQNIAASAEKTVSTSYGTVLYKLEGITSRFFANGTNYGYFINDVPEQEVLDIADAFILPNDYYLQQHLLSKIQSLCADGTTSLMNITTRNLSRDANGLVVQLQGTTADGTATCKIAIDPSLAAGGTIISYVSNTPTATPTTNSTPSTSVRIDTSVKQFPISLDKTMTFTSTTRGYTLIFPSMNIAYATTNVDENLDLPGVRCFSQMNVTKYADKATMNDNPKVKIFVCTIQGVLNNLGNSIIQKENISGVKILIQIVDPAWAEFANNIIVQ